MYPPFLISFFGLFLSIGFSALYLLFGYRIWRFLMTLNGIGLGINFGLALASFFENMYITAVAVLVLVGIFGNLFYYGYRVLSVLGCAITAGLLFFIALQPVSTQAAAGAGLVSFFLAAFLTYKFFRPCLILWSALGGAVSIASSIMMLLIIKGAASGNSGDPFESLLKENMTFTLGLGLILFLVGVIFQFRNSEEME